jgi:hypothetical protein
MMRELEIARELKRVRTLLRQRRATDGETDILYGAQQALSWVLERGVSPSELVAVIEKLAEELARDEAAS